MSDIRKSIRDILRAMIEDKAAERTAYFGTPRNPIMVYPSEYRWLKRHNVDMTGYKIIRSIPIRKRRR